MNEIEVGDYYRTKKGLISKVKTINTPESRKEKHLGYTKNNVFLVNGRHTLEDIKIYSKNKIDLVEVGDYVNGILVTGKEGTLLYTELKGIDRSGYHIPLSQYGENIKSIVTKEQFKSVEYIF